MRNINFEVRDVSGERLLSLLSLLLHTSSYITYMKLCRAVHTYKTYPQDSRSSFAACNPLSTNSQANRQPRVPTQLCQHDCEIFQASFKAMMKFWPMMMSRIFPGTFWVRKGALITSNPTVWFNWPGNLRKFPTSCYRIHVNHVTFRLTRLEHNFHATGGQMLLHWHGHSALIHDAKKI